ncbi:hypothetical protein AAFN75_10720 [Algibacter sp. AS12]|uniref:hypothetical protein n=1 Tax=Algibacter sp. AS12 TaxID=3135773 RepID=UPI00398AA536
MQKFLVKFSCFFFLLILLNALLNHYGNKIYLASYKNYSTNFNSFLLSDSHGLPLSNNAEKNGIFNFSAGSDSYFDMKRKINFLLKRTCVDTIYLTVDDHTLSPYRERQNNLDRSIYFSTTNDYSNILLFLKEKIIFNIAFFHPKKRTLLKKYIISFFNTKKNDNKTITQNTSWDKKSKKEQINSSIIRFNSQFPGIKNSKALEQTLIEIIQLCKKENITLIGLKFPLSKEYINIMGHNTYGANKIFKDYNLKVLDFKNKFVLEDKYFLNQDHLNEEGGTQLIEILFRKKL